MREQRRVWRVPLKPFPNRKAVASLFKKANWYSWVRENEDVVERSNGFFVDAFFEANEFRIYLIFESPFITDLFDASITHSPTYSYVMSLLTHRPHGLLVGG